MAAVIQLETRGLTRSFGGLHAVDHVALPRGGIHALIGPNGAGKSTFVGLVSGRIPASSGSVLFEGRDISALPDEDFYSDAFTPSVDPDPASA